MSTSNMTSSATLDNVIRTFIAEAQLIQEHKGAMDKIVQSVRLPKKQGKVYHRPYFNTLDAVDLSENSEYDDPQGISDTDFSVTITEKGCQVMWPYRLNDYITENLPTVAGKLIANALEYKRDTDLLTLLDSSGASLGSSGTLTLTVGLVNAALNAIREGIPLSGGTARTGARSTGEPATSPLRIVLQERQRYDLMSQLSGLSGTPSQVTTGAAVMNYAGQMLGDYNQKWIETYYQFHLNGAMVVVDNNISTSGNVAKGGVFSEDAYLQVTYRGIKEKNVESDDGRFTKQTVTVDYGYGVEIDPQTVELYTEATAAAT